MKQRMWKRSAVIVLTGSLIACGTTSQTPNSQAPEQTFSPLAIPDGALLARTPTAWLVELHSPPTADGGSRAATQNDKRNFRAEANRAKINLTEKFSYDTLFNGMSVSVNRADVPKLARLESVKAIWPVEIMRLPEMQTEATPDMASAIEMTGVDQAHDENFTGKGVRVGVMDTGIDYHHPDLGGSFGPGSRVFTGYDFVGDAYDYGSVPVPDNDPDDCHGHGTHVAGIIGASGNVRGVAPDVTFGAYKVFGCDGSTSADIMIAAMERALNDGMHVLNMSIGSAYNWPQYPTAMAANRLVNKGVVVVASIGNSGGSGLYSAGSPGLGEKVIGVASVDNVRIPVIKATVTDLQDPVYHTPATGGAAPLTAGSGILKRTGTITTPNDACSPLPAGSLAGRVALIRRGSCFFHTKAMNAQNAGAVAIVMYNNVPGRFVANVLGSPTVTIPVSTISNQEGVAINALAGLDSGNVSIHWTNERSEATHPTSGRTSSFSSYGLSPDLTLKPDISGPGGLIRSTYPLEQGSYATISGTSMSSPHVAGVAALVLQAKPRTPAQAMRTILQNTAEPFNWGGNPALGLLDNVHRQGAGMVKANDAIHAVTRVEPSKLSLGESESGPATRNITIQNDSSVSRTYTLRDVPAVATGPNTFTPAFFNAPASVSIQPSTVTVPAGGSANVSVSVAANGTLANLSQYGGYIVIEDQHGSVTRVPYAGLKGDYQSIRVLQPGMYGLPLLTQIEGPYLMPRRQGATYTMQGDDIPWFVLHLAHQSRRMRAEVFDSRGRAMHRAFELEYLPRNSTPDGYFVLGWDGYTSNGRRINELPNGTYTLKLSVLKALGDDNNPAHWETWSAPTITIARP